MHIFAMIVILFISKTLVSIIKKAKFDSKYSEIKLFFVFKVPRSQLKVMLNLFQLILIILTLTNAATAKAGKLFIPNKKLFRFS